MPFLQRHWRPLLVVVFVLWSWQVTGALWKPLVALLAVGAGWVAWWTRKRLQALTAAGMPRPSVLDLLRSLGRESSRKAQLVRQWEVACRARNLTGGGKTKYAPRLLKVTPTLSGDLVARIAPGRIGVDVDDVVKNTSAIAGTVGCRELVVKPTTPGCAVLTFYWSDPLSRVLPVADLPPAPKGRIAYGVKQDGSAASVELGLSILLGGLTRHGKSNTVWALLADLVRQNIPTDLYISDPKEGMELRQLGRHVGEQMGCLKVREYVTNPEDTVRLVKNAANGMRVRMSHQTGKNWQLSKENPLVLVILDELLPLHEMIKQNAKGDLGKILYTGSGAGYMVVANAQVGHADILGILRNLIPQRLCFRTKTAETTATILGTSAEARGAVCSKITERGIAFAEDEFSTDFERVRVALVDGPGMDRIALGKTPAGMGRVEAPVPFKRCAVYRIPDRQSHLLYVGKSRNPRRRFVEHAKDKPWWPEVDLSKIDICWFSSEAEASREETRAIKEELPRYNDVHNRGWNPLRRRPHPATAPSDPEAPGVDYEGQRTLALWSE